MKDKLLVQSKEQKDEEARIAKTIAEIVGRLMDASNLEVSAILKDMARRKEPPRNILMGFAAFAAFLIAQGIVTSGSGTQEEFADFISDKFREWLFEGVAEGNKDVSKH